MIAIAEITLKPQARGATEDHSLVIRAVPLFRNYNARQFGYQHLEVYGLKYWCRPLRWKYRGCGVAGAMATRRPSTNRCRWCTPNCTRWPTGTCASNFPGKSCRPRRWSTRRIFVWRTSRVCTGRIARTSLPSRRRSCGGFWRIPLARTLRISAAGACRTCTWMSPWTPRRRRARTYYWESAAKPLQWKFSRQDLNELLAKLNTPR